MPPMEWQSFLDVLSRKLRATIMAHELKIKIKREDQLVSYFMSEPEITELVSMWLKEIHDKREVKSLEKAAIYKVVGNKEFQSKKYASSLEWYTKSAAQAPSDSEDLSLAIANRSASLFYMGRYQDCIKDIELAIKLQYPQKLCHKLYLRAVQCYIKLGKEEFAKVALHRVREWLDESDDMPEIKRENLKKQVIQLSSAISRMLEKKNNVVDTNTETYLRPEVAFGENPDFPSASAGIEVKCAPQKGRYVVANRDIKKGQILFVEKPFAFVLLDHDKTVNFCENCCRQCNDIPIPCSGCSNTLFCNMNCWNEGCLSYHRWECPGNQMGLWQQIGIAHLALKVLLMCTHTTDNIVFNKIQELTTNFNNFTANDLIMYGITATMLTLYLSKYTDYFKILNVRDCIASKFFDSTYKLNNDLLTEDDKRLYVSSLLLRHTLQLISNGHAITRLSAIATNKDKLLIEQRDRIATAIYPSASMMNHSCDPNIMNSFMDQYIVVRATTDIAAGEEVFNCYGPHFRRMPREQRQEVLKSQYGFTCRCEPCVIPEYQNFLDKFSALKCPECSGALQDFHNYSMHCLDCGATPVINYQIELKRASAAFDAAQIYVELDREAEALAKLKECLSIRRTILYKYHHDLTATLDSLGKVYAIMGRWRESISYLEHSIAAVEERYGSISIELANELNKLTDICLKYLQDEPNRSTKWYKNILKKMRRYLDRAKEIVDLTYGPWNNICTDITTKQKILSFILKDFNI